MDKRSPRNIRGRGNKGGDYSQLQVTGILGAEGKDQRVLLNSGEVKYDLIGSFAGPESPRPCSQSTKLLLTAIYWRVLSGRRSSGNRRLMCDWKSHTFLK